MKKIICGIVVVILTVSAGCMLLDWISPPEKKAAKREDAAFLLENLAQGMRLYSLKTGAGGSRNFPSDLNEAKHCFPTTIYSALPGVNQSSYSGWVVRLEEYPTGDKFRTNFRIIASPAPGFNGNNFCIDKTETFTEYKTENKN